MSQAEVLGSCDIGRSAHRRDSGERPIVRALRVQIVSEEVQVDVPTCPPTTGELPVLLLDYAQRDGH